MTGAGDGETVVHASAVAVGEFGVLIRGKAGSGKSSLALALIDDPRSGGALIGDDRVVLERRPTGINVKPQPAVAGLIEARGVGILSMPYRDEARLALIVDLLPEAECPRLPDEDERTATLLGREIPRLTLPIGSNNAALRVRLALQQWIGAAPGSPQRQR